MAQPNYELDQQTAELRSSIISDVTYNLLLNLQKGDEFVGASTATFNLSDNTKELWIDLRVESLNKVILNGSEIQYEWADCKLQLRNLNQGENVLYVEYKNKYGKSGLGLHTFTDSIDNEQYLYTQFEAFYAHRVFPCFDQPDLKAQLTLTVKAPSDWIVIANEIKQSQEVFQNDGQWVWQLGGDENQQVTRFNTTPKISTYLYAVCAGPYHEYRLDDNPSGVPLGLYCRQTLKQYLVPERYLDWTVKGLKFYNEFFDVSYPFSKYDQVFVPEFNFGAMENVGCVTYRDQYTFKDPPSQIQLGRVCDTFLHEMGHMWFGNLVTMKWWDDLWLNESFATFMSHLNTQNTQGDKYPQVWNEFLSLKGWGYETDQLSTTHSIYTPVENTGETETNFDGISYAKGSAVLKQLYFLVGDEKFRLALQAYMRQFAFSNSTFQDLINKIQEQVSEGDLPFTLQEWADSWIRTAGLNQLEAELIKDDQGVVSNLKIKQSACSSNHPTLRYHKIVIEVFDQDCNSVKKETVFVLPQEITEIVEFNGLQNVSAVLLNVEDWDYCKIVLDQNSLETLKAGLDKISSSLTRQIVWRALWDMVRDLKLSAAEYVEFMKQQLPTENDVNIANYVLEEGLDALFNYIPHSAQKEQLAHDIFEIVLNKVQAAATQDESLIYQKRVVLYLYHPDDIQRAVQWVQANDTGIPNFQLSQNDRWGVIRRYSSINMDAKNLLEAELQRDNSDIGQLAKLFCEAAYPDIEIKREKFEYFKTKGEEMSRYQQESSMQGFNRSRQTELLAEFSDKYFDSVLEVIATKDRDYTVKYCSELVPTYVDENIVIEKINQILPSIDDDKFDIKRMYRETVDNLTKYSQGKALSARYLGI